ncbi:hypothetical protein PIB30_089543 [Stylosanthes scabra]|uniref:Uncharacterized protein n=1 Tax=Stylosanthes scabra TaxID=79078 RepID=A0ABU6TTS0_9FABA|nr:hypothetical protein [Stylosanthes scabra]
MLEEDLDNDIIDDGYIHHHYQHSQTHNNDVDDVMAMFISGLSIGSPDADADGVFSEDNGKELHAGLSSVSKTEFGSFNSLPGVPNHTPIVTTKDDQSENEEKTKKKVPRRGRRKGSSKRKNKDEVEDDVVDGGFSGESDQSGSIKREGVRVIVMSRPKGGSRSLWMDMEEVKACRDLGFEFEIPTHVSAYNSTIDETSSGGNSSISNWRISRPGDDPREVKARLKMWAHAVAAFASKYTI